MKRSAESRIENKLYREALYAGGKVESLEAKVQALAELLERLIDALELTEEQVKEIIADE